MSNDRRKNEKIMNTTRPSQRKTENYQNHPEEVVAALVSAATCMTGPIEISTLRNLAIVPQSMFFESVMSAVKRDWIEIDDDGVVMPLFLPVELVDYVDLAEQMESSVEEMVSDFAHELLWYLNDTPHYEVEQNEPPSLVIQDGGDSQ